jgi:hypothetical protein
VVSEALRLVSASGGLSAAFRGAGDPFECQLLDSCGLTGTVTAPLGRPRAPAFLTASGPAKRPYRDFLAALGLDPRGNPRGIEVFGDINWSGGAFSAVIDQAGRCTETGPTGAGAVTLELKRDRFVASYTADSSMRTRCPGPFFSSEGPSSETQTLATGTVGAATLRPRTFTLRLNGARTFTDDGYSIVSHSRLSLVIRRGRLSQHVSVQPG